MKTRREEAAARLSEAYVSHDALTETLGRGVYTMAEAARLIGAKSDTVRRWVRGRRDSSAGPLFRRDYEDINGRLILSFHDLIELWVVDHLRRRGMPLAQIRRAIERLSSQLGTTHPFGTQRARVLMEPGSWRVVVEDERGWLDVVESQHLMRNVLEAYFKLLDFDAVTQLATRFWPEGRDVPVVVDPLRSFGAPIIVGTGVPVAMVKALVAAGDDVLHIATAYGLTAEQVAAARDFMPRAPPRGRAARLGREPGSLDIAR